MFTTLSLCLGVRLTRTGPSVSSLTLVEHTVDSQVDFFSAYVQEAKSLGIQTKFYCEPRRIQAVRTVCLCAAHSL